jgi:oxaloacetate decarboxylase
MSRNPSSNLLSNPLSIGERRQRLRAVLAGTECISPASVYDPLSARLAADAGFEIGLMAGSIASFTTLAAPDIALMTLTELADQVRRITRASDLSMIVDADHGFGNALNTMRTIEELEHAGACAVLIEDTDLPVRHAPGRSGGELISLDEMVGKLRAALAARTDPSMVVVGRTASLAEGIAAAEARVKAFEATGVDAIMVTGISSIDEVEAMVATTSLPLFVGHLLVKLAPKDFAVAGVRVLFQGHQPLAAALKALWETYVALRNGEPTAALVAAPDDVARLVRSDAHREWQQEFLPH